MKIKINQYKNEFIEKYQVSTVLLLTAISSMTVLWLDYINVTSLLSKNAEKFIFIGLTLIIIIISLVVKWRIWDLLVSKLINLIDLACIVAFTVPIVCMIGTALDSWVVSDYINAGNKIILYFLVMIAVLKIICNRVIVTQSSDEIIVIQKNIYDIKDVYENEFELSEEGSLFLKEIDVDYDLLNRTKLINTITNELKVIYSDYRFVVSIVGPWGAGKSTVINLVIKELEEEEDIIIVNEFEPWKYPNQESLLDNMLQKLFKAEGFTYSSLEIRKLVQTIASSVLKEQKLSLFNSLFSKSDFENVKVMKKDIELFLTKNNKRVIYVIDNLDRIDDENILLILNIIHNTLDIKGITFVLSYDKEQLEKTIERSGIPISFLNKIIQKEIILPKINPQTISDLMKKTLENVCYKKGIEMKDLGEYKLSLDNISSEIQDLRELKRIFNSNLLPNLAYYKVLNYSDLIYMDYLKGYKFDIYNEIYKSKKWLTYSDISDFTNIKYNTPGTSLISTNPELEAYFFKNREDIIKDKPIKDMLVSEPRVGNRRFFDLYFYDYKNEYIDVKKKIESLSKCNDPYDIYNYWKVMSSDKKTVCLNELIRYLEIGNAWFKEETYFFKSIINFYNSLIEIDILEIPINKNLTMLEENILIFINTFNILFIENEKMANTIYSDKEIINTINKINILLLHKESFLGKRNTKYLEVVVNYFEKVLNFLTKYNIEIYSDNSKIYFDIVSLRVILDKSEINLNELDMNISNYLISSLGPSDYEKFENVVSYVFSQNRNDDPNFKFDYSYLPIDEILTGNSMFDPMATQIRNRLSRYIEDTR